MPTPGDGDLRPELPDADARRALFELYRGGLAVDTSGLDGVLARTDGALEELLDTRNALTRTLLGSAATAVQGNGSFTHISRPDPGVKDPLP